MPNRPLRGGKASMFEGGTRVPCVVSWPGITHVASRSEALVQSEDFFPTLIEGLGLPKSAEQMFDGYSFLSALRQQPYQREAAIQYFPHSPQVPDWLPPSVSIHDGDWKLIRIFYGSGAGKHRYKLFNLGDDVGESHDLANAMPEHVQQLDAKIDKFLERTSAVTPAPNPAFDPSKYDLAEEGKSKPKPVKSSKQPASKQPDSSASGDNPDMLGWRTRQCSAEVIDGVAVIRRAGKEPFLGFAAGKLEADAKLRFRLRCNGGEGMVAWLPSASASSDETPKPKEFVVKAGAWVEVSVAIHAPSGKAGIVRLFLPNQEEPIELDWIELETKGTKKRWDF
ncbi:MAG: sulfatase-like hydrolase/transferase [Pirellulales bacterium]